MGDFLDILKEVLTLFYKDVPELDSYDLDFLDEDLDKLLVKRVMSDHNEGKIYKIILVLERIQFEAFDKNLR